MSIIYNGGFLNPIKINSNITINVNSDILSLLQVVDDNTTYKSRLKPNIINSNINESFQDPMTLEIFWDETTYTLPGAPQFIESPPDDWHPMPEIEYSEGQYGAVDVNNDRYVKTPHFIVKKDSTSKYYGKDRYDNFMTEPLSNFGWKFNWFDNFTSKTTFGGGDLYASPTGLHLSFLYVKSTDNTSYLADLYHSKYSDVDGTFINPTLIESNIDVGAYGRTVSSPINNINGPVNRKTNPRFLFVPNVGLLLSSFRSNYDTLKDTTSFYIDLKISRDDGTIWNDFNMINVNFYTDTKDSTGYFMPIDEIFGPHMHWVYAENKIICLLDFKISINSGGSFLTQSIINYLVSEDLGKSFKQYNIDLSKLFQPVQVLFANIPIFNYSSTIYYDYKISKFIIALFITGASTFDYYSSYGIANNLILLTNRDINLNTWDIIINEQMSSLRLFENLSKKPWTYTLRTINPQYNDSQNTKLLSFTGENSINYLIANGGMINRTFDATAFSYDYYADFTNNGGIYMIPNPILLPIELNYSTDSYLNQFRFSNAPWRSRKLIPGNINHRNQINNPDGQYPPTESSGIVPAQGSSLSMYQDGIIFNFNETKNQNDELVSAGGSSNRFYILSGTLYKNNIWMLGSDHVLGPSQENRYLEYQIPTLIYRPEWSNVNIKARKNIYFTPTRYYDSTFVGWRLYNPSGNVSIEYLQNQGKHWQAKFLSTTSGFSIALQHLQDPVDQFLGRRGSFWDADSTRGTFQHFICSLDSRFQNNNPICRVSELVLSTGNDSGSNMSDLFVNLNKDTLSATGYNGGVFSSSTSPIDGSRDIEILNIINRFKNTDSSHEHFCFAKYCENTDWTLFYYDVIPCGSFVSADGYKNRTQFGNIYNSTGGDGTSVVYFKYYSEGWSSWGMNKLIDNVMTNKYAVLPQPCLPVKQTLPKGLEVFWSGQDATCGARFLIKENTFKNSLQKLFDLRPNIGWKSEDITSTFSINIDFKYPISFNAISMYNHNLFACKFYYGQTNNTTDLTEFLLHSQAIPVDTTDFRNIRYFGTLDNNGISIIDNKTLLINNIDFTKFYKTYFNDVIGKIFMFKDSYTNKVFTQKCVSAELLNDSSIYIQFENPQNIFGFSGFSYNFTDMTLNTTFLVLENRHLYILNKPIIARYIKIQVDSTVLNPWNILGYFNGNTQPNFDGHFKIGSLNFGLFEGTENPIENNSKFIYLSPSVNQSKYSGSQVPIIVSEYNKRLRFEGKISASIYGPSQQFNQIKTFVETIGGNRDFFFFIPRKLSIPDSVRVDTSNVYILNNYGFDKMTTDFYLVRNAGQSVFNRVGLLANFNYAFEEVI